MTKKEIRKKYTEKRKTLSQDEVLLLSELIFKNFLQYFNLSEHQKVHCFLPISDKKEVDTQGFIEELLKRKIRVFVPKIVDEKLISVEINAKTNFIKSHWGIPEPESNEDSGEKDFDFVITPLLYSDNQGNRVGYGKGFYDSFFENISPFSQKIGVIFFDPDEEIDDVWEGDIPLDYLVTPTAVLSFGATESKSTK